MARPLAHPSRKKRNAITIRFTDAQLQWLEAQAQDAKRTLADYCRWSLLMGMPSEAAPVKARCAPRTSP